MTSQIIEEEAGTFRSRPAHRHSGYFAGRFGPLPQQPSAATAEVLDRWFAWGRAQLDHSPSVATSSARGAR
jgi:hypothetical protein